MKFLLCVLLFVTVASAARPSYNSPLADDRQLFYGDLAGMKTKRPTVESNYNHYEGDEYQPINDYKKPAYYETDDDGYGPDYLDVTNYNPSDLEDQNQPSVPSYNDDGYDNPTYFDDVSKPTTIDNEDDYRPIYEDAPPEAINVGPPFSFVPTFTDEFYVPPTYESDDSYNNYNDKPTNVEQGDDDYDGGVTYYGVTNQQKPAPKPYKPTPEYPKEVVLLKPSAALKANAYSYKHATPDYKPHAVPGTPGKDYPNYDYVPQTGFDCLSVKKAADYSTDYYSNYMIPDREAGCQVFHSCHPDGRQDSFLCPLGTIFDGETQTCDWWFNARCY